MRFFIKNIKYLLILVIIFVNACSNKYLKLDNDIDNKIPTWFVDFVDEDENNIYAIATAMSPDMQLSLEKSKMLALNNLAQKLEGLLSSNFKISSVRESVIAEGDINIIIESFSTRGFKEQKREIFKTKGDRYRTYLKISLDKSIIKSFDDYIIESN